jgi:glucosamine--fructose-6-phosphate aminotransferase (isomerizing)
LPDASRFLQDVLAEPRELRAILARLLGPQRAALEDAARRLRAAPMPWIAGMGSSFHGGFAIQSFFDAAGRPARNVDAGELLHFGKLPAKATLLVLSRSGRSVEVVELVRKVRAQSGGGADVIGVTNDPESPLAKESRTALLLGAPFDFNVSVTMYSGVALAGALAAAMAIGAWSDDDARALDATLAASELHVGRHDAWRHGVETSGWCVADATTILLARGPGLAAAMEARQLFEEAAKQPATAHSTGAFRHGPNEVIRPGCRVILWLPADETLRPLDLALASDLRDAGASVALIGSSLPADAADLSLELPPVRPAWQFMVELMPARLLVESVSRVRGVDCDRFQFCPFVVASEEGLGEGHGAG